MVVPELWAVDRGNIRRSRPRPSDHWHLDEMVIRYAAVNTRSGGAIDNEGEVLDFFPSNADGMHTHQRHPTAFQGAPRRFIPHLGGASATA
jgi:transposase-like protein